MENKIVLVRDSVSGKGLDLAKELLDKGVKVMINGPEQEQIIEVMQTLSQKYNADLIYGVPGCVMSVTEYSQFYSNPQISEVVSA